MNDDKRTSNTEILVGVARSEQAILDLKLWLQRHETNEMDQLREIREDIREIRVHYDKRIRSLERWKYGIPVGVIGAMLSFLFSPFS